MTAPSSAARRDGSARSEVHCAACGAWFELLEPGPDVRCTLCGQSLKLGSLRRVKRGVPRRGGVDLPVREDRPFRRSVASRGLLVLGFVAAAALVIWWGTGVVPGIVEAIRERWFEPAKPPR